MTFELPLFPLNTVLFPGMSLPLHIFEPRYRLMIARCLEAGAAFGVLLMTEGQEGRKAGVRHAEAGCVARITAHTPLAHGRMNIQTSGERRFRVVSTREQDEYLVGKCEWLDDEEAGPDAGSMAPGPMASKVCRALRRYLENLAQDVRLTGADPQSVEIPADPYQLSMWAASLLSLTNSQKQNLLELTSTPARLEAEYAFLRRTEIVRQAWLERAQSDLPTSPHDETLGALSPFVSLN
jgi:Lon protease-like protein